MGKLVLLYLMILGLGSSIFTQDRNSFYDALSSGSEEVIDRELAAVGKEKRSSQNLVFEGALLMKKAGFEKGVNSKVKTFKKGARQLEAEIEKNSSNVEYRFIRLTIQEHAPGILKYNKKLNEDKAAVIGGYHKLGSELKSVISEYSKNSKILKEADLKGN